MGKIGQHLLLFILLFFVCGTVEGAKKNDKNLVPEYQLQGAGMTSKNAQQVTVTVLTNKKDAITDADLEKAAIHGVLFRDYDDTTNAGFGSVASHKAIMGSPTAEAEYIDFFEPFFRDGGYAKYVQIVGDSRRVVKAGKQWKVSVIVRVNTAQLKKDLEKQGLYKGLGGGW